MEKKKVLIIFAHPLYEKSRVNQILNSYIPKNEYVTFHDLYELYPEFEIDILKEKKLILAHDYIIWQSPMYWYSTPALLKQWMDMVLHFKDSKVFTQEVLKKKAVLQVLSVGEQKINLFSDEDYELPMKDLLKPFRRAVDFCTMQYMPPLLIQISKTFTLKDINDKCAEYGKIINGLVENTLKPEDFAGFETMNDWLDNKNEHRG